MAIEDTPKPVRLPMQQAVPNLPQGCNKNNMFHIPTYVKFIAQGSGPWTIEYSMVVTTMRKIWTVVY